MHNEAFEPREHPGYSPPPLWVEQPTVVATLRMCTSGRLARQGDHTEPEASADGIGACELLTKSNNVPHTTNHIRQTDGWVASAIHRASPERLTAIRERGRRDNGRR